MKPSRSDDTYVPGSGDDGYRVKHYDLELTYRPASNRLSGTATLEIRALRPLTQLSLDFAGLTVEKVSIDDQRARKYAHRRQKLVVTLERPVAAGAKLSVAVKYSGQPRPMHTRWGDIGWEELREGALVAGQPTGARTWFPCNDHPRDKATYRFVITTDSPFAVLANGTLLSRRTRASTTTWTYEQRAPMAAYLATVQIGSYEIRDLPSGKVPQRVARPARLARQASADFGRQDRMMRCFTELFGPYPFDAYTVVVTDDPLEIPLEAQGLSVFGSNHLDGRRSLERLVAHELAHQWFGNSLTVTAWSDIWLNEGFACYAEWLWSEWSGGSVAHALAERYWKRLRDEPHNLVLVDPGPDHMFDDRVYKRGALTLHALRAEIGTKTFVELIRTWVAEHRHGLVSTEAFLDHAPRGSRGLLRDWLCETKVPSLPKAPGRLG
jgi:aminopeptidase